MVGVRGLEPPTPRPPGECATRLRHTPTFFLKTVFNYLKRHNKSNRCLQSFLNYGNGFRGNKHIKGNKNDNSN